MVINELVLNPPLDFGWTFSCVGSKLMKINLYDGDFSMEESSHNFAGALICPRGGVYGGANFYLNIIKFNLSKEKC